MKRFVFVALILLHCVITTASGKEMMKDEFSITVPDDWVQIPVYMIEEHENLVAINTPNAKKQHYDYGFQPDSNKRIATPYILLQINYGGRMPKKEIIGYSDFSLQESMDKENFGPSLTKLKVDKLTYDKTTNRIWMRMESVVNGRDYTSLSGIIPTENGYILAAGNT
ncbi:MAG: hypothetical protein KJ869_04875, partial [Candidatus Edwardsbacteria bacterium]|nr:hypothetical protein [Candidatus Edwardsbacteria bacterium]